MRVDRVELRLVEMPFRFPFVTSFGREAARHALLVRCLAGEHEGWGEVVATREPLYNEETVETARHMLRDFLVPLLFTRADWTPSAFARAAGHLRRNHMAKAGLEAALWDLQCSQEGRSLASLLGGERSRVEVGVSLGIEPTVDRMLARMEEFVRLGYRRVKLKIGPGSDVEFVRAARSSFPALQLQVDANSAYRLEDRDVFRAMDDLGLLMIEQPLDEDDLVDHAALQGELRTPLCLDESLHRPEQVRRALDLGACRVVNVKPGRLGGLSASLQVHELCRQRGVPAWCGGMLETGIGRLQNLALASLPGFTLPGDLSASDRYFSEDLVEPPVVLNEDGTVDVPREAGVGSRVEPERVRRFTRWVEVMRRG